MATFDKNETKARVEQHIRQGNFFFPEDLARAVAEALGVDVSDTSFGQDAPAQSRTRGDVPPFSGAPAADEFATEDTKKAMKKYEEQRADVTQREVATTRPRITRESVGHKDPEDKVKDEGPIYPKDDPSTPEPTTQSGGQRKAKGGK